MLINNKTSFIDLVKNLAYAKTIHEEWAHLAPEIEDEAWYDTDDTYDDIPVCWDRYDHPGQYYITAIEAVNRWYRDNNLGDFFDEDDIFNSDGFQKYENRLEAVRNRFAKRLRKSRIWKNKQNKLKAQEEREWLLMHEDPYEYDDDEIVDVW